MGSRVADMLYATLSRAQKVRFRHNLYKLREERDMDPRTFSNMISSMLYERR